MKYVNDLFGVLCREYFDTGISAELKLELDNGIIMNDFPVKFYVDTKELRPLENKFLNKTRGRILDVGCGPGRIGLILKDRGFDVTGIDCSEHMAYVAQKRGLDVYEMDINKNLPQDKFDSFILYGNGFGMPGSISNIKSLLHRLHKISNSNAIIIAESNDPNHMTNKIDLDYQEANLKKNRYVGYRKWRSISGEKAGEWCTWVQTEPALLKQISKETGWRISDGPEYEKDSQWGAYFFALTRK
ncbi:MAG: class I SAM-dependent methyltransferase [Nanoarchaeota archaeon]|nr:class I SAM-dependent methyltransferase [Nanoarchaeota archaeon]MBU4124373.1 class I SAM-dependent methyltransferase [Nanoarchaeota archaeon]